MRCTRWETGLLLPTNLYTSHLSTFCVTARFVFVLCLFYLYRIFFGGMAMLPRTRKSLIALGMRVFVLLTVVVVYSVKSRVATSDEVEPSTGRRHLLGFVEGFNCTPAAIKEFPSDGFTREQRKQGWIALHFILSFYLFALLAIVCDDYFVPCIKKLCDGLSMKEDIAGATFMAVASSSPELFINSVGTFVTEGDIGVGTIVGSAVFNILAVPACSGLFAHMAFDLEWWPLTRDSLMYGVSVIMLITFLRDGRIEMNEALVLVLAYIFYILMMCFNEKVSRTMHKFVACCRGRRKYIEITSEHRPLLLGNGEKKSSTTTMQESILESDVTLKDCDDLEESTKIWQWPHGVSTPKQIFWVLTWPISFALSITIPDSRKHPKLYPISFIMCIAWIGSTAYTVAWVITVIGDTLNIPDSVMGLTFLAAGTSVPEAVSAVIVTNQGHGAMGLSSSIGSNTFDILLCLGLPWLIKTAFYPKIPGKPWIQINSSGLTYSAVSLLSTLVLLYLSFLLNRFRLDWKIGVTCLFLYLGFLSVASLIELNVFFPVNLPTCDR